MEVVMVVIVGGLVDVVAVLVLTIGLVAVAVVVVTIGFEAVAVVVVTIGFEAVAVVVATIGLDEGVGLVKVVGGKGAGIEVVAVFGEPVPAAASLPVVVPAGVDPAAVTVVAVGLPTGGALTRSG